MKKIFLLIVAFLAIKGSSEGQTVTDADGNVYQTVIIDTQEWIKENLKTTRFNDGIAIPLVSGNTAWENLNTPAYCYYNNDSITNKSVYGAMYNWYAVNTGKLCPVGWRVPTNIDWNNLIDFLGGSFVASSAMRESGTLHWLSPNSDADNSSNFTALPAGHRMLSGNYNDIGGYTSFWTSTEDAPGYAPYRFFSYLSTEIKRYSFNNDEFFGLSVRCMRTKLVNNIRDIEDDEIIKVYPNPASDKIYINVKKAEQLKIQFFNSNGVSVMQSQLNSKLNEIDISGLSKGIYTIQISNGQESYQKKLVKL